MFLKSVSYLNVLSFSKASCYSLISVYLLAAAYSIGTISVPYFLFKSNKASLELADKPFLAKDSAYVYNASA